MSWLGESEIPFCIVFTKADKIGKTKIESHVAAYRKQMIADQWEEMPQYFVTSSENGMGKDDVLSYIDQLNQDLFKSESQF